MLEMREHIVREKWIDIDTFKIIRDKLRWCYRIEGVNHLQKCCHLVQQYMDSTPGIGWGKTAAILINTVHLFIPLHYTFVLSFSFFCTQIPCFFFRSKSSELGLISTVKGKDDEDLGFLILGVEDERES
ncbi:putative NADH dehydrogenase [ubiquinone] 1 beta subcomplex subunit 10 [Helianthus anomalus]